MYELHPIISFDTPIELPNCMYRLKNIHADTENAPVESLPICTKKLGTFKQNIESRGMAELEDRQIKILSQLEDLKKIMQSIKSNLKLPSNKLNPTSCTKQNTKISTGVKVVKIPDLVINASPLYPPYFLMFLQRLLKNEVYFNVNCHLHSSVSKLPNKTESFVNNLNTFQANGVPSVNVRLIWKEIGPHAELSDCHYPIQGEANILRYIVRTLDNELNYEKHPNPEKIDSLLDLSYKYTNSKNCRSSLLQYLNKSMTKSKWLGGQNALTIADIAVYDSLKKFASNSEVSGNLNKWYAQCDQYVKY